jgi:signal transduction histidine kinase
VDNLLDMSRVQAGHFSIDLAPTALAAPIQATVSLLEASAAARGQRILDQVGADLPLVMANAERIGQIVENLVTNAMKYTPEGSTITIRAARAGDRLRVEVADDGPGIAEAERVRIFAPFTQLDMSKTRARGGVGLGLSIVKALVEAQGGAVGVESAPGQGATFWFTLPLAPA